MKHLNLQPITAIVICTSLFAFTARGQYYPGGLSNTNLKLWLDANDLSTITKNGANQVSIWADKSIASSPLTLAQATLGNEPVYTAAGINARPSLTFNGTSDQYLALQSTAAPVTTYFQGYNKFSHFSVYKSTNNVITTLYGRELLWKNQISAGTGALHLWASATGAVWGTSLTSAVAIPVNSNALISAVYNSAGTYDAYNLGSSVGSVALGGQVLGNNANGFTVGARTSGPEPLTGAMGEVLIFNRNLSNSERIIVENFLSAKWGIALSANTHYTVPTATTYGTNLVGIGYATAADKVTSTAQTDGLGFSSGITATDFLNSAGYLMAAHNGQGNTILTNASISGIGTTVDLWNRSWYLNLSGGNAGGKVTLNFNFADYNGSALPGVSNYFLVYNATDGSFATGTNRVVAINTSTAGSTASFLVKASLLANGYYTIMWWPSGAGIGSSPSVICPGNNITFSASALNGCSYQWQVNTGSGFSNVPVTDPGGAVYSGAASASLTITGATFSMNGYTYQVILTPPGGPALTEGPVTLAVNPPAAAQALAANANPICSGSSTILSIVGPVAGITCNIYSDPALTVLVGSLTSAANTLMVSPAVTTTYYEQAVDGTTGCVQTAASQNITVTVNPVPAAQPVATSTNPICLGSSTTLSIASPVAGIVYNIYSDPALTVLAGSLTSVANSLVVSPVATTTYYEQAVDGTTGCVQIAASQNIIIPVTNFAVSLTANPDPIVAGFPVTLTTGSSMTYQVLNWMPVSQFPDQTALSQTFTIVDTSQSFSVIAQSFNGCLDTASVTVIVNPNTGDFFIPNAFTPNGNGKNDVFRIYGSSIREIDWRIFNQWGQLMFESQDAQKGWDGYYSGHRQPAGVYLYFVKVFMYGQPAAIFRKGSLHLIR